MSQHLLPIVNFEHRYNFFLNAKCGSVTASLIFLEHCGFDCEGFESDFKMASARPHRQTTHPNHVHECRIAYNQQHGIDATTYKYFATDDTFTNFKLVRNPFTRALSGYLMFMRGFANRHAHLDDKTPEVIRQSLAMSNKSDPTMLSFLEFCNGLTKTDVSSCNPHFLQQTHPLELNAEIELDVILKLEQLRDDLEHLFTSRGFATNFAQYLAKTYPHHSPTEMADKKTKCVSKVAFQDLGNSIPARSTFYCDQTRTIIERVYQTDLERYDYQFPF